jgi:hypothetical protein
MRRRKASVSCLVPLAVKFQLKINLSELRSYVRVI